MKTIVELIQEKLNVTARITNNNIPKKDYVTVTLLDFVAWFVNNDDKKEIEYILDNLNTFKKNALCNDLSEMFYNKRGDQVFEFDGPDTFDEVSKEIYDFFSDELYTRVYVSIKSRNKIEGYITYSVHFPSFTYFSDRYDQWDVDADDYDTTDFLQYVRDKK